MIHFFWCSSQQLIVLGTTKKGDVKWSCSNTHLGRGIKSRELLDLEGLYDIWTVEHHAKCHRNHECRMRFDLLAKWQVDMLS